MDKSELTDKGQTTHNDELDVDFDQPESDFEISQAPSEFHVENDNSANWLIKKVNEARAYQKRCAEWCEREQCRARRTEEYLLGRYGPELERWAREKIAAEGARRKSINLPAGAAGFRTQRPILVIDDERQVVDWARQNKPDLIVVQEKLSKSALNDHFKQTGELPPAGAHVEPERETFYIK